MTERLGIEDVGLAGLRIIRRHPQADLRGYFERLFSEDELSAVIGRRRIREVNRSRTTSRGTVRGFHYRRPPYAELKIVTCLRGSVFDVAVDVRRGSPSFLRWHGEVLTDDGDASMLIPEGFAHGFQALTDDCELLYLHTATYRPKAEAGINPQEPKLGVVWPNEITIVSPRDLSFPMLGDSFRGIVS